MCYCSVPGNCKAKNIGLSNGNEYTSKSFPDLILWTCEGLSIGWLVCNIELVNSGKSRQGNSHGKRFSIIKGVEIVIVYRGGENLQSIIN